MTRLPKYTCPNIDDLIAKIKAIEKALGRMPTDTDELISVHDEIEYEISGFEDELERLRKSNDELRAVAEQVPELEECIEELKDDIKGLESELKECND